MEDHELASVNSWLNSTGYPLEYAAAHALMNAGFEVDVGRIYRSEDGQTLREADLVAILPGEDTSSRIRLVCECKFLPTPWVVLTRNRSASATDLLTWAIATDVAKDALVERATEAIQRVGLARSGLPRFLIETPLPHGSSIVARPKSRESHPPTDPHLALLQVTDAARSIMRENRGTPAMSWPALIVRGPLFQARLAEDGSLQAERLTYQRVIWGGITGTPTVVDIVHETQLDAYAVLARDGIMATTKALRAAGLEG